MSKFYPLFFVMLLLGCQKESFESVRLGDWGGEHARLQVTEDFWYMEFDCAHLIVNQPVVIQENTFESPAEYYQEYPVQFDDQELYKPKPARIEGVLKGSGMEIKIIVEDQVYGTYTLIYQQEAKIYKCA